MGNSFHYERLANTRRIRKVKRLIKKVPLFAYTLIEAELPGYSYEQFLADLKTKNLKSKKRRTKSALARYGRFYKMNSLIELYKETGDTTYALKAMQLRRLMTKPYRIYIKRQGKSVEYNLSPLIPYSVVENLVAELSSLNTLELVEEHYVKFSMTAHIL